MDTTIKKRKTKRSDVGRVEMLANYDPIQRHNIKINNKLAHF